MSRSFCFLMGVLVLSCVGCGSRDKLRVSPAEGKVTVAGQPAAGAVITFYPVEAKEPPVIPNAVVGADGSFRLTTYKAFDGAPEGDYLVSIVWEDTYKNDGETLSKGDRLRGKYKDHNVSGLKAAIHKGKNEIPTFDLVAENAPRGRR